MINSKNSAVKTARKMRTFNDVATIAQNALIIGAMLVTFGVVIWALITQVTELSVNMSIGAMFPLFIVVPKYTPLHVLRHAAQKMILRALMHPITRAALLLFISLLFVTAIFEMLHVITIAVSDMGKFFAASGTIVVQSKMNNGLNSASEKKAVNMGNIGRALKARFVNMEHAIDALIMAFQLGRNVVFYGRGGYGKSELCGEFFKHVGISPFIQSFHGGITEDAIYGGINMNALNERGEIVYNTQNSFLNSDYAVFEELFDAPTSVLLALKDTLTAKELRNGAQRVKSTCRMIVACTNKSFTELIDESNGANTVKALLERFPFSQLVQWSESDHNAENYLLVGKSAKIKVTNEALLVCVKGHARYDNISPRVALSIFEAFNYRKNINDMRHVSALSQNEDFDEFIATVTIEKNTAIQFIQLEKLIKSLQKARNNCDVQQMKKAYFKARGYCNINLILDDNMETLDTLNEQLECAKDEIFELV